MMICENFIIIRFTAMLAPLLFRKELRSAKLIDHFQKLTEFAVEPFKGWRGGWLVIGVREFLNGDCLKMLPHDLLGQVIV